MAKKVWTPRHAYGSALSGRLKCRIESMNIDIYDFEVNGQPVFITKELLKDTLPQAEGPVHAWVVRVLLLKDLPFV